MGGLGDESGPGLCGPVFFILDGRCALAGSLVLLGTGAAWGSLGMTRRSTRVDCCSPGW